MWKWGDVHPSVIKIFLLRVNGDNGVNIARSGLLLPLCFSAIPPSPPASPVDGVYADIPRRSPFRGSRMPSGAPAVVIVKTRWKVDPPGLLRLSAGPPTF